MNLFAAQDKATARQRPSVTWGCPLSNNSRGAPLPHLYYDSPPLPFISLFLALFQRALDFTPIAILMSSYRGCAFVPSLLRYSALSLLKVLALGYDRGRVLLGIYSFSYRCSPCFRVSPGSATSEGEPATSQSSQISAQLGRISDQSHSQWYLVYR